MDGKLGHGDAERCAIPTVVSALIEHDISMVTCGGDHSIAASEKKKELFAWGG
jgi:alpha-tubulin suppressor-like RCC1 family protein